MLNLNEFAEHSGLAEYLRQIGKAEGKREGKREGMRDATQRIFRSRFGTVPKGVLAAVRLADEEALDALAGLLSTGSFEQIRTFLELD